MSKEPVIKEPAEIDRNSDLIDDEERLLRLLCSPKYFNKELNLVNADAFDLRTLRDGELEEYVSLARIKAFRSEEKFEKYLETNRRRAQPI